MPGARCTRSLACKIKKHTSVVTTGSPGSPGIPARNGFNSLYRALPGDRALLSPSPAEMTSANLTPASRRQDHTTSPSASHAVRQLARPRPPHPAPRSVTLRNAPRSEQDGNSARFDLPDGESTIFLQIGLDRNFDQAVICPSGSMIDLIARPNLVCHPMRCNAQILLPSGSRK